MSIFKLLFSNINLLNYLKLLFLLKYQLLNYLKLLFLLTSPISRSFSPCNSRVLRWLRPSFPCSLRVPAWLDPLSLWAFSSISKIVLETGMASEIRIKLLSVTHASWLALSCWNINVRWWSLDLPFERGNLGRHGSIEFNYGALVE